MSISLRRIGAALLCAWLGTSQPAAAGPGVEAGRVWLTPAATRVADGANVSFDVVIDFSDAPPVTSGGFVVNFDSAVLDYVSWSYASSTIGDDPSSRPAPVLTGGDTVELAPLMVATGMSSFTTPGIVGTLTLQAVSGACQSAVTIGGSPGNPWSELGTIEVKPDYFAARVGVGDAVCLSPAIDPEAADMPGRCIAQFPTGLAGDAGCAAPLAGTVHDTFWDATRLFPDLPVDVHHGTLVPLADHLARYCLYDRVSTGDPPVPAPTDCEVLERFLSRQVPGAVVESMSMSASGQAAGASLPALMRAPLREQFEIQAGKPSPLPTIVPRPAKLWVLDTTGGFIGVPMPQLSSHGPTLRELAQLLLSGGPVSVDGLFGTLVLPALPFQCFDETECLELCGETDGCAALSSGGFLGSPQSVASSLHNAIAEHLQSINPQARLVLSLSLGWLEVLNEVDGVPRPGFSAFVDVLTEAACLGALVVAAAGNDQHGPSGRRGLLFPAAQMLVTAPDKQRCTELGYAPDSKDFPAAGESRPLLYAVSAVNADGSPLLARQGGQPPLAAFGDHANTGEASIPLSDLATLTGSSVAAMVASVAASLVWAYDPDAAPHKIMQRVYDSGTDLGRAADVCFEGPPCPSVKRISVCDAVAAVCASTGDPGCPQDLQCPVFAPTQVELPFDALDAAFAADRVVDLNAYLPVAGDYDEVCNAATAYALYAERGAATPLNPCPQQQYFGVQAIPWAKGQPAGQSCPECNVGFRSPGTLYVEIAHDFGETFNDPTLLDATLLCRHLTGEVTAFRLPDHDAGSPGRRGYAPGERLSIVNLDPALCPGADIALAFSISDDVGTDENGEPVFEPASAVQQLLVIREDEDDDLVPDFRDNCTEAANPLQHDTDGDGYGNACDPDIAPQPNDCIVNFADLDIFKDAFFSTPGDPDWNADADLRVDGMVNFRDLLLLKSRFFGPPGPSALSGECG